MQALGFNPWSGEFSDAMEQLSLCATTTEPVCLEAVLHNKRSDHKEKPQHHHKEQPHLLQLGKAHEQQQRPGATKKKKN